MTTKGPISLWIDAQPYLLSALRIVAATVFIFPGTMKLFAYPTGMPPEGGTAGMMSQVWVGGVLEAFGGMLLLLGFCTRPIAFIVAGEMAVAYFQFHFPNAFWPIQNGGTDAVLYCFIWLFISSAGAGPWSLDALRAKRASMI